MDALALRKSALLKEIELLKRHVRGAEGAPVPPLSLREFLMREFLPAVSAVEGELVPAPHLSQWAELLERHRFVCIVAFRGSLKSTLAKAVVAHALRSHARGAYDAVYYSATVDLARWHLRRLKLYLESLAPSWGWRDATAGEAVLRYERPGAIFSCEPAGLIRPVAGVAAICSCSTTSRTQRSSLQWRIFNVLLKRCSAASYRYLKDKSARVLLVGTPLIEGDVIAWAEKNPEFVTTRLPAILPTALPRGRKSMISLSLRKSALSGGAELQRGILAQRGGAHGYVHSARRA
jgi:hypothetical protein